LQTLLKAGGQQTESHLVKRRTGSRHLRDDVAAFTAILNPCAHGTYLALNTGKALL
jgi:hypothetical protein